MERVHAGKILGAWETVGTYPNALEADLFERGWTLPAFFDLPCRTQINLIHIFARTSTSNLFAEINGYEFTWGNIEELLAQQNENFINANQGKGATPYRTPRPSDKARHGQYEPITDEEQALIDSKLPPLNL